MPQSLKEFPEIGKTARGERFGFFGTQHFPLKLRPFRADSLDLA